MSQAFGSYVQDNPSLEPGIYDAIVESAKVVNDENGHPKVTEHGKHQVDISFRIDRDTAVNRRYSISFGQNRTTGAYADFAQFLSAATGIPLNESGRLRALQPEDLEGKRVRIVTQLNDKGYINVTSVAPPPKGSTNKPKPVPAEEYEFPDEIPF